MSEGLLTHCKTVQSNLISSDEVNSATDHLKEYSEGIENFLAHYCYDDHISAWCRHDKVR